MIHHVINHIERVREKPDHKKKQYALFVSLGITSIIFVFWITSFTIGADAKSEAMAKVKSPIGAMTASAGDAYDYIKTFIFGANKTQYSSDNVEVTAGKI